MRCIVLQQRPSGRGAIDRPDGWLGWPLRLPDRSGDKYVRRSECMRRGCAIDDGWKCSSLQQKS